MAILRDGVRYCSCGTRILSKSNWCNYCSREKVRDNNKKRRESGQSAQDVYNYSWRVKNPEKYIFQSAKARAKSSGIEFDISVEDIEIPEICPALGIPILIQAGKGASPNSPSLDRIDSSKGYVKGNIQVLSWRANNLKSDSTPLEMKLISEFMNGEKRGI